MWEGNQSSLNIPPIGGRGPYDTQPGI